MANFKPIKAAAASRGFLAAARLSCMRYDRDELQGKTWFYLPTVIRSKFDKVTLRIIGRC